VASEQGGPAKDDVRGFWNEESCGEALLLSSRDKAGFEAQARERYRLEPYICDFARFSETRGLHVLEIGVGLGADHQQFAEAGAKLSGIDLTSRAIEHTRNRLALFGLTSNVQVGDAENLPFTDETFDMVYSWGVIHHSPDTPKAASEILRVLKPGGRFAVMIYQTKSLVGVMLWLRYALIRGKPFTSMAEIYSRYLESPGTKAYSINEAKALFRGAAEVHTRSVLTHGDLLESGAGQRHRGRALALARMVWPRGLIRRLLPDWGLFLLVEGTK
jgi:SAM-dependent methyltransferase